MSHAAVADVAAPLISGKSRFFLRRLHSLTGIIFGGYLVVHLLVNATLLQGTRPFDVYQQQVDKIHQLPFLLAIEWVLIYLPIIFHAIYGISITLSGQPNTVNYPFAKNWLYMLQRISAFVLMIFILFHVLAMKDFFGSTLAFDPQRATATTARHFRSSVAIAYIIYPIGILAACFHLANGFWTAAITWGLTISSGAQRRWGLVCIGIFAFTLVCGFGALAAAVGYR